MSEVAIYLWLCVPGVLIVPASMALFMTCADYDFHMSMGHDPDFVGLLKSNFCVRVTVGTVLCWVLFSFMWPVALLMCLFSPGIAFWAWLKSKKFLDTELFWTCGKPKE